MRIRRHLSFANVVALIALFVALGGGAYALKSNSVGTKQLKKNAVAKKNLKKNAVVSNKVKNKSLQGKDVKDGTLTGEKIAEGSVGSSNITGIPKAWANVSPAGAIKSGKGITAADITLGTPGFYCFEGVGGATVQVTGSFSATPEPTTAHALDAAAAAELGGFAASGCPATTTWMVITTGPGAAAPAASHFTVAFFD